MNRSEEQTNRPRIASRFTRFVCPALRFIPHEPRKKDTHSLSDRRKTIVKPATYDGKTSWIDFKSHIEICAQLNDWTEDEEGLHLAVLLRDGAQA